MKKKRGGGAWRRGGRKGGLIAAEGDKELRLLGRGGVSGLCKNSTT